MLKTDNKTTLPKIYHPLMQAPTMIAGRCFICGRRTPLEQHHFVWRSWGKFYRNGVEVEKPTITLCGFGNNLQDANGHYFCHGMAHHRMLHFRWHKPTEKRGAVTRETAHGGGYLQFLVTSKPTDYMQALEMDGWRKVHLLKED